MRLVFTLHGWDDYKHWRQADPKMLKRIDRLIDDALRDPTDGIGKPEPFKHMLADTWSRRVTDEHHLVYLLDEDDLVILQAPFPIQMSQHQRGRSGWPQRVVRGMSGR